MSNDNSFFRDTVLPLAVGGIAAHQYVKKIGSNAPLNFVPKMDPRSNLLDTIQSLKIDNLISSSAKKYEVNYALSKVDFYQQRIESLNKFTRLQKFRELQEANKNFASSSFITSLNGKLLSSLADENLSHMNEGIIKREWEAAVNANFPNPTSSKVFSGATNSFDAIKATIQGNQSVLTQRSFRTFERNMDMLFGGGNLPGDMSLINVKTMFPPGFSGLSKKRVRLEDMPDSTFKSTIFKIQSALDTNLDIHFMGAPGQGMYSFNLPGAHESLFDISQAFSAGAGRQGLIRTGSGLQNVYSPGEFAVVDDAGKIKETLNYSEFKAKRILDTIKENNLSYDAPGLRETFSAVSKNISTLEDYREVNLPGMNFYPETMFRSQQVRLVDDAGETISDARRVGLAKELFGKDINPGGAQSRFIDTSSQNLYGEFGEFSDHGRRPFQLIKQYLPTEAAQEAMNNSPLRAGAKYGFNTELEFMNSKLMDEAAGGAAGARLKTMYLSEEQLGTLSSKFGINIEDGELLISKMNKKQFEVQRTKGINLFEINCDVAQAMTKQGGVRLENISSAVRFNTPIATSGVLGRTPEGIFARTQGKTELLGISPSIVHNADDKATSSLDLVVRETLEMSDSEKVLGSVKGMARFVNTQNDSFVSAMSSVTGLNADQLSNIGVFARADDIKDSARQMNAVASNLIIRAREAGVDYNDSEILSEIKAIGHKGGDVKSALEEYSMSKSSALGLDTSGAISFSKGGVAASQLFYGGPKELTGAGNIATIDPRAFNLMKASNPGGMNQEISEDFISRMIKWNPSRVSMHQELMKTVGSLSGEVTPGAGDSVIKASDLNSREAIDNLKRRGGFVETGLSRAPQVYVPGWESVPELHPRLMNTGALVDTSESSKIFNSMIRDVKTFNSGSTMFSENDFMEKMEGQGGYLARLTQEVAISGKGSGSLSRGQIPGSRALTLLSEIDSNDQARFSNTLKEIPNINDVQRSRIVGISWDKANEMFAEMEKIYGTPAVSSMKKEFESGGLIAGMAMRHPTIGPYSTQPVMFTGIDTKESVMLSAGNRKSFDFKDAMGNTISKELDMGPLAGWAADKDADTIAAIMMEPQQESKMRSMLLDSNSMVYHKQQQEYADHAIRMQLLKPKATKGADFGASLADQAAASSIKLGATKEEVGKISTALTKARTAVMASNLDDSSKLRSLSTLEWLEQIPISAKHVSVENVLSGAFQRGLTETKVGVGGDAALLEGNIASLSEGVPQEFRGLFGEGIETAGGQKIGGMRVSQTSRDIVNSIVEFKALPRESQLAASARYGAPSAFSGVSFNDLPNVLTANRTAPPSAAALASRNMIAEINTKLGSVIQKAKPYAKAAAVGVVAAVGASLLFGGDSGTLNVSATGTANRRMPTVDPEFQNTGRDEVSFPSSQKMGSPTVSPQMPVSAVQLDNASAQRKSIHVKINANNMSQSQRQELVSRTSGRYPGSEINLNIRDDRKRMNAHSISDMLDK